MTEDEWLATLDPLQVLTNLVGKPTWRKMQLAAVACCHRMKHVLTDERSLRAVEVAELYADRSHGIIDTREAEEQAAQVVDRVMELGADARNAAHCAAVCLAFWAPAPWGTFQVFQHSSAAVSRAEQMGILACVFGVPHRLRRIQITLDPSWLTPAVVALAAQMYESRDFGAMPILADALQDAGCDSADVLDHCRGPGPHVRGCWVVDLILGKE